MSETIELRQKNPDESEKMAKLAHPDNDVYGYISRPVADKLGEYLTLTVSEEAEVTATKDKSTKNFGVYETAGGHVVGLGIRKDVLESVFGEFEDVPESIGLQFEPSDEEAYDDAHTEELDEEEEDALIAGLGGSDESDDEEEEVEISDEELNLVSE